MRKGRGPFPSGSTPAKGGTRDGGSNLSLYFKLFLGLSLTIMISVGVYFVFSPIVKNENAGGVKGPGLVQNMVNSKVERPALRDNGGVPARGTPGANMETSHGVNLPETSGHIGNTPKTLESGPNMKPKEGTIEGMMPPPPGINRNSAVEEEMLRGIESIRAIKKSGRPIETDPEAQAKVPEVQNLIRTFLVNKYGPGPYKIEMDLTLPNYLTLPEGGQKTKISIEMAPIEYVPYAVYFFLEHIIQGFHHGAFHRNAGHVLQAMLHRDEGLKHTNFAWQEYSSAFPHKQFTLGYAGRPSGSSAIYISTLDNTYNHGPASQGSKTEADVCWGKLVDEHSKEVMRIMQKQKGGAKGSGFVSKKENFIHIDAIRLVQ